MSRRKTTKTIPCPACDEPFPDLPYGNPGVSQSRYNHWMICSNCGVREALTGFFWR